MGVYRGCASCRTAWNGPLAVAVQQTGAPASTLVDELTGALGTALVRPMSGPDMAKASGMLFDATNEAAIVHPGQEQVDDCRAAAVIRPIGRRRGCSTASGPRWMSPGWWPSRGPVGAVAGRKPKPETFRTPTYQMTTGRG